MLDVLEDEWESSRKRDVKWVMGFVGVLCAILGLTYLNTIPNENESRDEKQNEKQGIELWKQIKIRVLRRLLKYLGCGWPKVRRGVAEGMYVVVSGSNCEEKDEEEEEKMEEVEGLLVGTDWDAGVVGNRGVRERLGVLFGV